ncbi:MAG: AAA family ATPase [Erysipelotrichaceae bacterium]|nr:AAA family ATPase [Erysipelotrichaceae bacterium]
MKIVRLDIENYGRFHKYSYEFKGNLTVFMEQNGWGKTTMASFIKAMFYGLEYSRAKDKGVERRLYRPWNGGKFGGSLDFDHNGKTYRAIRFFGQKVSEDSFELYDLATNMKSADFGESLGLELWGVDRDSYEKTAFINLAKNELLSDLIASRLSQIETDNGDLDESSVALALLEKEIGRFQSKRGNKGIISDIDSRINEARVHIGQANQANGDIERLSSQVFAAKKDLDGLDFQLQELEKRQKRLFDAQKKRQYVSLQNDHNASKTLYESHREFFHGVNGDPDQIDKDLNAISDMLKQWLRGKDLQSEYRFTPALQDEFESLSNHFNRGIPEKTDITSYQGKAQELYRLQALKKTGTLSPAKEARRQELAARFKNLDRDEAASYLDAYGAVMAVDSKIASLQNGMNQARSQNGGPEKRPILLILGALAVLFGAIMMAIQPLVGGIFLAVGIVLGIFWFVSGNRKNMASGSLVDDELASLRSQKQRLAASYLGYLEAIGEDEANALNVLTRLKMEAAEYGQLESEAAQSERDTTDINRNIEILKGDLAGFLGLYNIAGLGDPIQAMADLGRMVGRYEALQARAASYEDARKEAFQAEERLAGIFGKYYEPDPTIPEGYDFETQYRQLRDMFYEFKASQNAYDTAKQRLHEFEGANDVMALETLQDIEGGIEDSNEEIAAAKTDLAAQREDKSKAIALLEKQITDLEPVSDSLEDWQSQLAKLEEERSEAVTTHELLTITFQCLEKAKENMAAKYTSGMNQAFKKYLKLLEGANPELYQVDINLDVNYFHEGQAHSFQQLSKGMQDLVQICLRLALVEAVYQAGPRPLLILDDPFVNLDETRLNGAKGLIEAISDEYQVFYFICHESRMI